jgi:hypothetical protein
MPGLGEQASSPLSCGRSRAVSVGVGDDCQPTTSSLSGPSRCLASAVNGGGTMMGNAIGDLAGQCEHLRARRANDLRIGRIGCWRGGGGHLIQSRATATRRKQHGQLNQGVFAAGDLVGTGGVVARRLEPLDFLALDVDRWHAGHRDRREHADRPQRTAGRFNDGHGSDEILSQL